MSKNITRTQFESICLVLGKIGILFRKNCAHTATRVIHALVVLSLLSPSFGGFNPGAQASSEDNNLRSNEFSGDSFSSTETIQPREVTIAQKPAINRPVARKGIRPMHNQELQSIDVRSAIGSQKLSGDEPPNSLTAIYVQNVGQFDPRVQFEMKGYQGAIRLANDGIWVTLLDPASLNNENYQIEYDRELSKGLNPDHIKSTKIVS
jgi:hypothetical protein